MAPHRELGTSRPTTKWFRDRRDGTVRWSARRIALAATVLGIVAAGAATPAADAEPIGISGYDLVDSPVSGSGGWAHNYTGTIEPTGTDPVQEATLATYTGGSGTLNDGAIGTTTSDSQLFFTGTRAHPTITLHLPQASYVDTIDIYGGDIDFNAIPGALTRLTVSIAGTTAGITTEPFGDPAVNDRVALAPTPLSQIPTDTIVLSATSAELFGQPFDQFSITEIKIDGRPVREPEVMVGITIRPRTIAAGSNQRVTVAVLSTSNFDAANLVDPNSLTFGRTGRESTLKTCGRPRDVNGDGRADLVCRFQVTHSGLRPKDTRAVLRGTTTTGRAITGSQTVHVVR